MKLHPVILTFLCAMACSYDTSVLGGLARSPDAGFDAAGSDTVTLPIDSMAGSTPEGGQGDAELPAELPMGGQGGDPPPDNQGGSAGSTPEDGSGGTAGSTPMTGGSGGNSSMGGQGGSDARYIVIEGNRTWLEAQAACKALGRELAKIQTAEEDAYIRNTFPSFPVPICAHAPCPGSPSWGWIGLNDRKVEGVWRWTDDTAPTYTNWAPGQPNNNALGGGEDCVSLVTLGWNDAPCDVLHASAICEQW